MKLTLQWIFAAAYGIVALIAGWGGVLELNPPLPSPTASNPDPLPLLVNAGMATAAAFYFLTAGLFGLAAALSVRAALAKRAGGIVDGLNLAFAAFLTVIGVYLAWYGGQLAVLGGSLQYVVSGIALVAVAVLLVRRNALAAVIYAGIVAMSLVWAVVEAGLDFIALMPRVAAWVVVGVWFVTPWHRAAMGRTAQNRIDARGRWVALAQLAGIVLLAAGALQTPGSVEGTRNALAASSPITDWRHYGNVPEGQRFAQIDQINAGNVGQLQEAWRFRTGVGYDNKNTPLMVGDLLYHCTADIKVIALEATTGREVWRHDTQTWPGGADSLASAPVNSARACRGVGYHEAPAGGAGQCAKRILVGTTDARLIAMDALNGRRCVDFGFDGEVNLRSGLGPHAPSQYFVTAPPLIAGNRVIVGGLVSDNQQLGNPSGVVRAYDAITGEFIWAWDMGNPGYHGLPEEGGEYTRGTPNVWSSMSYDPGLGLIYAPTGNASPDYFDGDLRSEFTEKYASSIVAIDAATGEPRWVYQTVHRDIWDYDVPAQPVLVDIRKDGAGELIPAVAQPTKMGEIYLLDRRTGTPIFDTPEMPAPQNPEPGERVAATQPLSPLPHFRETMQEHDMWGLTPLDQLHCRIEFRKMRYEGRYTPPMRGGGGYGQADDTWGGTFQLPGNLGGFNWGSVSVDADNGLLVAAPMRMGSRLVLKSQEDRAQDAARNTERRAERAAARGESVEMPVGAEPRASSPPASTQEGAQFDQSRILYRGESAPFMSGWRLPLPFLRNAQGQGLLTELPCPEPPYGEMAVIDLNTNKLLWRRPFGSMQESGPFGIKSGLPFMVGTPVMAGSITTRGGLIFHGGAMDSTFRAFDLRTGEVKWEAALPGSAHAMPITYVGADGRQYVVITVPNPSWRYPRAPGAAGFAPTDALGGYVIAFALPD